jgi:hypothetical protein
MKTRTKIDVALGLGIFSYLLFSLGFIPTIIVSALAAYVVRDLRL